jgi:HAD superfamily hydrolase (TIGR01509 family)
MDDVSFDVHAVEVLLFDLGGVVIDLDFGRCMAHWARSAGCDVDEVTSRFSFDAPYEAHERGTIDAAAYFETLRHSLSVDLSDEQFLAGWSDIYLGATAGVASLLRQAATMFPLYAFTNSNPSHQAVWSSRFADEMGVFTETFVSSKIGHRKPDQVAFDAVATAIGVGPSRILFFDDVVPNVVGARQAGMQAVHVTSPRSIIEALALLGVVESGS